MKIEATLGDPTEDGIYACRQWYCWRILEWWQGAWWHVGRQCRWPVSKDGDTGIEAHFGPLPTIVKDHTLPPPHRGRDNRTPQAIVEPEAWERDFEAPTVDEVEYDL